MSIATTKRGEVGDTEIKGRLKRGARATSNFAITRYRNVNIRAQPLAFASIQI